MHFVAYTSKFWHSVILAIVILFAVTFSIACHPMALSMQIVFGVLISGVVIAILLQLISSSPVITADENGLTCYKRFYRTIAWADIQASTRIPRVETYFSENAKCYHVSFSEGWRPIEVFIRDIDKYSKILPAGAHQYLTHDVRPDEHPGCFRLRIELAGTTGSSEQLQEVIQYYIEQNKQSADTSHHNR